MRTAAAMDIERDCAADCFQNRSGLSCAWAMARADCRAGHRTAECDRRPAPEDHHLPPQHPHAGAVPLVINGIMILLASRHRARIPCLRFRSGLLGCGGAGSAGNGHPGSCEGSLSCFNARSPSWPRTPQGARRHFAVETAGWAEAFLLASILAWFCDMGTIGIGFFFRGLADAG